MISYHFQLEDDEIPWYDGDHFSDYGAIGNSSDTFGCNDGASEPESQSMTETDEPIKTDENEGEDSDDDDEDDDGTKRYWEVKVNNGEKVSNNACIC